MAKIEEIKTGGAGGGVGAKKSAEDYANSYAVKALTDIVNLKLMASLPIFDASVEENKKGVTFEMDELLSLGYTGVTTGAPMQMFDRIFDTLEIPFVAGTIARDDKKQVKIVRYGKEFDASKYSTTRAGKPSKDKEGNVTGIVDHENSPEGLVECLKNWLSEVVDDELFTEDLILKLGLDRKMTELGLIE